jgi:hypothetical protein
VKNVSKSLKKVRLKMLFNGKNKTFYVEFIQNYILVEGTTISVQNYKIISLSSLAF